MTTQQKATLPADHVLNARNLDAYPLHSALCACGVNAKGENIDFAKVWIHRNGNVMHCRAVFLGAVHCAGYGRASGYGYHKPSAALSAAIESAGIKLAQDIDGHGDGAMRDALHAIGEAMGFTSVVVCAL